MVSRTQSAPCAWPGCRRPVPRSQLMCRPHWHSLPRPLRSAVWAHYQPGQDARSASPEYREALAAALDYARRVNAEAERQAALEAESQSRQGGLW